MVEKKYPTSLGGQMTERKHAISLKEVEAEYQELAARMNFGGSKFLPKILKRAFTLEQARVALELDISSDNVASTLGIAKGEAESDILKYQVKALAKKLNLDKETLESHIQYMFEVGFGFPTRRGWRFSRNWLQAKDSQTHPKFDEKLGDEYFDLWEAFLKIEVYPTVMVQNQMEIEEFGPTQRVIPARQALLKSMAYEDIVPEERIEEALKQVSTIAVELCPCKRLVRDRACHSPTEVCLIFDRIAEHNLRRGAARVISVEEALAIHDMANEFGLVCLPMSNAAKATAASMICHCHWCCCDPMTPAVMMNIPLRERLAPSCYQAMVDPNKCISCQTCLTRCPFGAIEMKRYPGAGRQEKLKAWVDPDKCMGCGLCVLKCPADARTLKQVRTSDSIPREMVRPGAMTATPEYKAGKHLETGSLMTRPFR